METKEFNIAEILKDCPKGTKLYSPIFGCVVFDGIEDGAKFMIKVIDRNLRIPRTIWIDDLGRGSIGNDIPSKECMLFPAYNQRDWSKFRKPITPPFEVKRERNGAPYFIVHSSISVQKITDNNTCYDDLCWERGNYFNTYKQAEYAAEKVKELLLSLRKEAGNE